MGVWGTGVFDNDGAADFCIDVDQTGNGDKRVALVQTLLQTAFDEPITLFSNMFECAAAAALIAIAVDPSVAKDDFEFYGPSHWATGLTISNEQRELGLQCLTSLLKGPNSPKLDPAYSAELDRYLSVLQRD